MYEAVRAGIDVVLAGSIRDDGPLPDVITDVVDAQERMRDAVRGAGLVLMIATMLHSIATGNLLPARVETFCVDISAAVSAAMTRPKTPGRASNSAVMKNTSAPSRSAGSPRS